MTIRSIFFLSLTVSVWLISGLYGCAKAQDLIEVKNKYPDYSQMFLGNDKHEKFNRKMYRLNSNLNKCALRPIHTVWESIMPKYGMDRIQGIYTNMIYPRRLVSTLVQKDFKASKTETIRFLTNTTIGIAGMFDPAKRYLKIDPVDEDMEQALAKCNVKQGTFLMVPVIATTSPRNIAGRVLDAALDPTCYIGTPVLAMVKAGITVNRTSYIQPLIKLIESTYADPYEVAKKLYGLETYIKIANLDRKYILKMEDNVFQGIEENQEALVEDGFVNVRNPGIIEINNVSPQLIQEIETKTKADKVVAMNELIRGGAVKDSSSSNKVKNELQADIVLKGYNPQNPVVDAMRTAYFDLPGIKDSWWEEFSIWNRSFYKKVKTGCVNISEGKENYQYKYILQKDKNAPLAIIYPSIGEGATSYHSVVFGKLFYEEGYSVVILGSHFQWEFLKSMPDGYRPGIPSQDAEALRNVTGKILTSLQDKCKCKFGNKVLIGTSFGAMTTIFIAEQESRENTLGISKYISINPPIELIYAMNKMDSNSEDWNNDSGELKHKVAVTAAKVINMTKSKENKEILPEGLPFSEEEAKLITGFIMHQKLSDLVFTIENNQKCKTCSDFYNNMNNMSYNDYAQKYLLKNGEKLSGLEYKASLYSISKFLKNSDNYRIYHTLDDYLVNRKQLAQIKKYCGKKSILISNGSHLGFLYRPEFIDSLRSEIKLSSKEPVE